MATKTSHFDPFQNSFCHPKSSRRGFQAFQLSPASTVPTPGQVGSKTSTLAQNVSASKCNPSYFK